MGISSNCNFKVFHAVIMGGNMYTTSIYEARNNLSNYVSLAENGEDVILTRYNKPVAVITSYDGYEKKDDGPSFLDELQKLKEEYADVLDNEGIPLPPKVYPDPSRKIFDKEE